MALSSELAAIVATLDSASPMPPETQAGANDRIACPHCDAEVWQLTTYAGKVVLLNARPSAWGRWVIEGPGLAVFCHGGRMVRWPLPRYTSHYLDCPELVRRREAERERTHEEMRWRAEARRWQREQQRQQREAFFRRFEDVD